jgi:hypothetical protein
MAISAQNSYSALDYYDGHNARTFEKVGIESAPKAEVVGDWRKRSWEAGWLESDGEMQAKSARLSLQGNKRMSDQPGAGIPQKRMLCRS